MKKRMSIVLGILLSLLFVATADAVTVLSSNVFPDEIEPGDTATINIILENNLNEDVEDVSVSLIFRELIRDSFGNVVSVNELPFAPHDSSNEVSLDELGENDDEEVVFRIKALNDAESGTYKIPIEIVYYDLDGDRFEKDSLISLTVNAQPVLGVSLEESLLLKGQENELTVKVVNKGLSDVRFLEVEIGKGSYYSILSSKNVYVGDVDSDDFDSIDFKILFKENSPSRVNLPVTINYKDAVNNAHEESFILPLSVYTRDQATQLGLLKKSRTGTYITIIIVLIVIWIVYRKIRKRRKKKAS